MGLFKRKAKIEPVDVQDQTPMQTKPPCRPDRFTMNQSKDGLQIDFIEANPNFAQFYDTTRLIVQNRCMDFPDKNIYDCLVSWYGQQDAIMLDSESGELIEGRRNNYTHVLAQIDLNLLQTDPDYLKKVMLALLNESRVNRYMNAGMKTPEEIAKAQADGNKSIDLCGRYIGGIAGKERNYQKFFDVAVGKKAHNLPDIVRARQELRQYREMSTKREIESKQAEINKLRARLNELESSNER